MCSLDDDDIWTVRFQFYAKDNFDRTMCSSDITYVNLLALMDVVGFGPDAFLYYVGQEVNGIAGLELLDNDAMV